MLSFPFWNIILIEVFTNRFVKTKQMRGGGSWGDPITHSQCVTSYFSYINTNVNKQHNIMHDRQKPVSTIMVLSQKLFNFLIWEEQKKYTNKSKIRYELEVFISEQRLWSLVSLKVEKETKPVLSAEVHWIFSDVVKIHCSLLNKLGDFMFVILALIFIYVIILYFRSFSYWNRT